MPVLPNALRKALKIGGRLFVITGEAPVMEARLITRITEQEWIEKALYETVLPPLVNAPRVQRFIF